MSQFFCFFINSKIRRQQLQNNPAMNRSVLIFATILTLTLFSQCQCTKRSGKEIRQFLLDTSNLAKDDFQSVTRSDLSDEKDPRAIRIQPAHYMNNKPRSLGKFWQQKDRFLRECHLRFFWSGWRRAAGGERGRQHHCGQHQQEPRVEVRGHRW